MKEIDFFANKAKSLVDKTVDTYNIVRTLYYPPISILKSDQGDSVVEGNGLRFSEHSDWGIFTILLRDAINGLEVFLLVQHDSCLLVEIFFKLLRYGPMQATGYLRSQNQNRLSYLLEIC